jgi:hypothetical protein
MKFTTEQYNLICQTRDEIRVLNDRQHTLYNNLLKELNISIYAEDWMFDYIYNDSGSIENIEARM